MATLQSRSKRLYCVFSSSYDGLILSSSLYTICKRYTIKKVSTTKREALEFVQKFHLGTLNELEAHTGTKILIFQDEEARGFLVTGKRTEIGRAVEAMKQLLGRVIVNTLQFPKHQWLEALYPNDVRISSTLRSCLYE